MPHASLKLRPGVDQNETPALNEAGISTSQLVRFIYDRQLGALIQKLGGWTKFYPSSMLAVVRALWGWEDTNAATHLAVGTQNKAGQSQAVLSVITAGSQTTITPQYATDSVAVAASTTALSSTVQITDAVNTGITAYDTVYIQTHISVGGLILFGLYQTANVSSTVYSITAMDIFGNPTPATTTSTSATVAQFATTVSTSTVTVTLANHGFLVGSTYPVLIATIVGGVTIYGNYTVTAVTSTSTFTINVASNATSTASGYINGGLAAYIYSFGVGVTTVGTGYGQGSYGSGTYGGNSGAVTPTLGSPIPAVDWTLDNWGQILIACAINGTQYQPIYQWDPTSGGALATIIPQAPPVNDGIFLAMPQRQIVAWGSTTTGIQDPLLVRWCDVNNFGVWTAQVTNQAGSYRIPRGSKIVGGLQGPQQGLIWTDLDLWAMQYIGQPYVYAFNQIGSGCGLIGRKAAVALNGVVYWMGYSSFFTDTGTGVSPLACPVWDVIFQNLDTTNTYKIRAASNARFGEVTWYYPTTSSGGEVTNYVKYNVNLNVWDFGTLGRTAWVDQSVLGPPIGADPTSLYLYQHETSTDADGQAMLPSFTTGYFALQDGDMKTFIDQFWPDMKWGYYGSTQNATVMLTFYGCDYPGQTPTTYGPYTLTQATTFVTPRIRNRLVAISLSSSDVGSFWRIGNCRYRYSGDGKI